MAKSIVQGDSPQAVAYALYLEARQMQGCHEDASNSANRVDRELLRSKLGPTTIHMLEEIAGGNRRIFSP